MTFKEGEYYVIECSSIHNGDLEYKVVTCESLDQIEGKIKEQIEVHEKSHWAGEELTCKVWKLAVVPVPVKVIQREFQIIVGEK